MSKSHFQIMLFTFAGSSHPKYTTYLLEFITSFELESSDALRETMLNGMLVNLSGKEGAFSAGDLIQEFFNCLLEVIIEWKGAEFGALFICQVVSWNLHHMGRVKTNLHDGVGLAKRSSRHSEPHTKPEVKTLLKLYARHELHSCRPGRTIEEEDIDSFRRGWEELVKGKLRCWVADMVCSPSLWNCTSTSTGGVGARNIGSDSDDEDNGEDDSDEDEGEGVESETSAPTFGSMRMVDGQFIIETKEFESSIHDYLAMLDAEAKDGSDSDDREGDEMEEEDDGWDE